MIADWLSAWPWRPSRWAVAEIGFRFSRLSQFFHRVGSCWFMLVLCFRKGPNTRQTAKVQEWCWKWISSKAKTCLSFFSSSEGRSLSRLPTSLSGKLDPKRESLRRTVTTLFTGWISPNLRSIRSIRPQVTQPVKCATKLFHVVSSNFSVASWFWNCSNCSNCSNCYSYSTAKVDNASMMLTALVRELQSWTAKFRNILESSPLSLVHGFGETRGNCSENGWAPVSNRTATLEGSW